MQLSSNCEQIEQKNIFLDLSNKERQFRDGIDRLGRIAFYLIDENRYWTVMIRERNLDLNSVNKLRKLKSLITITIIIKY